MTDFAFQRLAGEQGRAFDAQCRLMLAPKFEVCDNSVSGSRSGC
jgi:hypothetical protein